MKNQNIKKLSYLSITLYVLLAICIPFVVNAQTATPKPTVSNGEKLIDEINNLREKVASKVAELNLVEKRGSFITVTQITGNKITGNDFQNTTRIIDVDELTKFSSPSAKSFGISDITSGSKISVIGLYNKQSKRLLARFINSENLPAIFSGAITEIDKVNFTITVLSEDKRITLVDIENITKTSSYSKEEGIKKLGFSKLIVGDRVHIVGFNNIDEKNRVSATRVLALPELPKNPKITIDQASDSSEDISATPSGRITPTEEN